MAKNMRSFFPLNIPNINLSIVTTSDNTALFSNSNLDDKVLPDIEAELSDTHKSVGNPIYVDTVKQIPHQKCLG